MNLKLTEYDMNQIMWCLGQSFFRIQAEFNYYTQSDISMLPYADRLRRYPKPTGYRRVIWEKLLKGVFKEISERPKGNNFEILGRFLGLVDSTGKALAHYTEEDYEVTNEALNIYGYTDEEFEEDFGEIQEPADPIQSSFSQMHAAIAEKHPEGLADFSIGYGEGLKLIFDPSTNYDPLRQDGRPISVNFYFFFLIFGDYLKTISSNRKIYQLAKIGYEQSEMPYDQETLLKYCQRIKFRGASYRAIKRRSNGQSKRA